VAELAEDIPYCDDRARYPDTTFDLYKPMAGSEQACPVFVYVHGGGYVGGSKNTQDLSCMGPGVEALFEQLLKRSCSVVSMDYTLAPAATYPTPVEELALLMAHLREHAAEYGIDMQRVAVGGGSAGGQIAGQYAVLCSNATYRGAVLAEWLGEPAQRDSSERAVAAELEAGGIAAVYFGCALLDPARFATAGDAQTDAEFSDMQRQYFGSRAENLSEANVIAHVTSAFPPSYITDGNYLTFDDQARELDETLAKLGVEHEAHIYAADGGTDIPHGYDVQDCDEARVNAERAAAFICEHVQ
jgi:acetyl esterase/lipase